MAGKQLPVQLPDDLRIDLAAFCEANLNAPAACVIREALRDYIDRRAEAEPALRERYLAARARIIGRPSDPIRLLNPKAKR